MSLDPLLLEILRCPDEHRAPLEHDAEAGTLTCTECARVFPIRDDIPILLLDEAVAGPASPPSSSSPASASSPEAQSAGEAP